MAGKTVVLLPDTKQALEKMGGRIKKARLRRNIRAEQLAQWAGISKGTLFAIEKGVSTVSMGAYAAVLFTLGLGRDFELVALDEEEKQRCREKNMQRRERASKRKYSE